MFEKEFDESKKPVTLSLWPDEWVGTNSSVPVGELDAMRLAIFVASRLRYDMIINISANEKTPAGDKEREKNLDQGENTVTEKGWAGISSQKRVREYC